MFNDDDHVISGYEAGTFTFLASSRSIKAAIRLTISSIFSAGDTSYRPEAIREGSTAAYLGSISVTNQRRPSFSAARAVVPVPPNGSRTS